jgi:hypothetical protein
MAVYCSTPNCVELKLQAAFTLGTTCNWYRCCWIQRIFQTLLNTHNVINWKGGYVANYCLIRSWHQKIYERYCVLLPWQHEVVAVKIDKRLPAVHALLAINTTTTGLNNDVNNILLARARWEWFQALLSLWCKAMTVSDGVVGYKNPIHTLRTYVRRLT